MKVVLAQASVMPLQEEALHTYFKYLEKGSIVVFGEYVFDLFFTALGDTSKEIIAQLYEQKVGLLQKLAKHYKLKIVTPLIAVEKNKIYKQIAIIDSKGSDFYTQQFLIDYAHWDEKAFFDNPKTKQDFKSIKTPYIFEQDGMRVGVMFGFEAHFDALWLKLKNENVDMVLVPSASAFESAWRWEALLSMRALCNGCMVVRINRTGKVKTQSGELEFYGQSFIANPDGEVVEKMSKKDGFACFEIDAHDIQKLAKEWGFRELATSPKNKPAKPSKKTSAKTTTRK